MAASACGLENNHDQGGQRRDLSHQAEVRFDGTAEPWQGSDVPSGGLLLTVANDLPVIREGEKIISQIYIEATVEPSWREPEQGNEQKRHRLLLRGKILSESAVTFWLSPTQVEELAKLGDGSLRVLVKDSVQVTTMPWYAAGGIRLVGSASEVQRVHVSVHTRHNLRFGASVK